MPLLPSQERTGLLIDLHAVSALHPYHAKKVPQDLQMQHQWVNKREIAVTNMEGEPRCRQDAVTQHLLIQITGKNKNITETGSEIH